MKVGEKSLLDNGDQDVDNSSWRGDTERERWWQREQKAVHDHSEDGNGHDIRQGASEMMKSVKKRTKTQTGTRQVATTKKHVHTHHHTYVIVSGSEDETHEDDNNVQTKPLRELPEPICALLKQVCHE